MKNDFDFIAPFYDHITQSIFGDTLSESQKWLINQLKKDTEVLIIGGGTGKSFEGVKKDFSITYLEKSNKMINLAKRRLSNAKVQFLCKDFFQWETGLKYDAVVLPFFLDCFDDRHLNVAIEKCKTLLKKEGRLLVADFDRKKTNPILNLSMHLFFSVFSNLESKRLKDIHENILKNGFLSEDEEFSHRGMIFSRVYGNP
ncbi:MAG: methyltransferase domain-containing protein [Ekhidna sp.]|nr:methyltransferase domain-containing protein [Ekhidna sp.]